MNMNWKKTIGIIGGVAIIVFVVFKLKTNKETTQQKVYQFDKGQAVNVQADTLEFENVSTDLSFSGTFEPYKETKISAEIQGKINDILVDVGSPVYKGQSLVQLDNSLLKLQLQSVEVQIEGLESDVARYKILANADAVQGIQLEKSLLGLKSAKVQVATLREQINKTTIKAPFNGVVTAKLSEEGAFAALGIPLLQITDIAHLKFTVNVPETDLRKFQLHQLYTINSDAYSEISFKGKAILIGSKSNIGSSFPIQFEVLNTKDLKVKSGMFGTVSSNALEGEKNPQEKGIIIPASAIVGTDNQRQVYLIKNGKAVLQNISISKQIRNEAVVSSGLNANDVIVTKGFINLFDGANVSIKN